jgi:CheY-like chemotaxis protein
VDHPEVVDILLVEDNPSDGDLTLRTLKSHKFANTVQWVKDGAEALDFLFRRGDFATRPDTQPRVVLLDLRLPKVDSLEVLKAMRADVRTRLIPVVVMTSSTEDRDVIASYNLGANSFVSKPVGFADFAKTVADLGMYWMIVNKSVSADTQAHG